MIKTDTCCDSSAIFAAIRRLSPACRVILRFSLARSGQENQTTARQRRQRLKQTWPPKHNCCGPTLPNQCFRVSLCVAETTISVAVKERPIIRVRC